MRSHSLDKLRGEMRLKLYWEGVKTGSLIFHYEEKQVFFVLLLRKMLLLLMVKLFSFVSYNNEGRAFINGLSVQSFFIIIIII